jgi:hypothetical protein
MKDMVLKERIITTHGEPDEPYLDHRRTYAVI